jgi:hypothetical protein
MVDVFVLLGTAIVKASVKLWLKDNEFAADVGASLTDLVSGRISDRYDQRKVRRIFEDLDETVGKRLESLRQTEFGRLPENEWNAAVIAAELSFDRSQLSAAELFSRDLDPLFLERYIRRGNPRASRDLSEGGAELYDRLISEGCAYVIEIADKLPQFQTNAFAELLHRGSQTIDLLNEVLDRIPSKAEGRSEEARFVTACRRRIATKLDRLDLLGLDFESPWNPLTVAYVSLRTELSPGDTSRAEQAPGDRRRAEQAPGDSPSVEQRLADSPRLLLLGRAGSGKTTVLQWFAVGAARGSLPRPLADFTEHFPFYLRLREFEGARLPEPEDFLVSTAPLMVKEAPEGWARRQLDSGQALVLVDGVDEVAEASRGKVADGLRELVDRFPSARYVVTARPEAVAPDWLADAGFVTSSLEAMPPTLVQAFIHNWYEATRQRQPDDDERATLDDYEQALRAAVTKDRYLRDLADTPLLSGLLCALNLHMRSNLPRRRTEIYDRALAMLDQRDRARGLASADVRLDLTGKTQVLSDLALWMVRNGHTEIGFDTADTQLRRSFAALTGDRSSPSAGALTTYLLERSGLLREPADRRVDFVHRTFQEYLAAKAAVDADAIGELTSNAGNDQWGEVVVLAAGQANQVQAARLLQDLLKRSWRGKQQNTRRALAVACLQEVQRVDTEIRREVEAVISDLLPPRSMAQAEQLSAAGPALISLLTRFWSRDRAKVKETIRAASLVGGTPAMDLIGEVVDQADSYIIDEVARAWQYFDTVEYARRVLAEHHITDLQIAGTGYLTALRAVPSLRNLQVNADENGVIDMAAVAELSQVTSLELFKATEQLDLEPLKRCGQLNSLIIWNFPDHFPRALPHELKALESLDFFDSPFLMDLIGIERFTALTSLQFWDCHNLGVHWKYLRNLRKLREISITWPRRLDLSGFWHTGEEMALRLRGCGDVDLSPLAGDRPVRVFHDAGTRLGGLTRPPGNVRLISLSS